MKEKQKFSDYLVRIPGEVTPFRMDPDLYCVDHNGELELCRSREKISTILNLYKKQKRVKKCANLKLMSTSHAINSTYPIDCTKHALYWHVLKNKEDNPEVLLGCPPKCQFYRPIWKDKIRTTKPFIFFSKILKLRK